MTRTLLIAQSDAVLCDIFQTHFERCGYDMRTASDGLDCLQKLREANPAVLLLDRGIRWEGTDERLAWLREERLLDRVLVVLTGKTDSLVGSADHAVPPADASPCKPALLGDVLACVLNAVSEWRQETLRSSGCRRASHAEFRGEN